MDHGRTGVKVAPVSDRRSASRRVALLWLALMLCASAAEQTAPPRPEESIESAKRDFEAIKAARNPAEQPRAELPQVTLPDISATPTPLQPRRQTPDESNLKAKKSKGWLVDAMEEARKEAARKSTADQKGETTRDGFAALAGDDTNGPNERGVDNAMAKDAQTSAPLEKPKPAVKDNPLTQYMAAWMTPQDYSLLRPVVDAAAPGGDSGNRISKSVSPVGNPSPDLGAATDIMSQLAPAAKPFVPSTPAENPFLAPIDLPTPAAMSVAASAAAAAPPPTVFTAPPPPPAVLPPSLPDLVKKSANDDKYYKPLKRF